MNIGKTIKNFRKILEVNAPVILTGVAVSGACLTAYFAAKGGYKSANIVREKQAEMDTHTESRPLTTQDKFLLTYKFYAPAALTLVGTSACMVMATKIGLDRAAAVAGAFVVAERANDQYRDKVKELLGENKHTKVEDAVATDDVNEADIPTTIIIPEGEQIFLDRWSGRTFTSTREKVGQAVNSLNHEILFGSYASLSDFYSSVGLSNTEQSDNIGWNSDNLVELTYTPVLKDDRAVVAFSFDHKPMPGFQSAHS